MESRIVPGKRGKIFWALLAGVIIFGFVGCAGSPLRISTMDDAQLREQDTADLCNAYYSFKKPNIKAVLTRRGVIPDTEWPLIEQHKFEIGMSEYGLLASWGQPDYYEQESISCGVRSDILSTVLNRFMNADRFLPTFFSKSKVFCLRSFRSRLLRFLSSLQTSLSSSGNRLNASCGILLCSSS